MVPGGPLARSDQMLAEEWGPPGRSSRLPWLRAAPPALPSPGCLPFPVLPGCTAAPCLPRPARHSGHRPVPICPPPSGPCSRCLLIGQLPPERARRGQLSSQVLAGGWACLSWGSVSPPLKGGGKGLGWSVGPELWDGRAGPLWGHVPLRARPHECLNPQTCPSLGDSGGQGPRAHGASGVPSLFPGLAFGATLEP